MLIYHALNRGVDKRKIFLDEKDYFRFVHDLFEFNDEDPATNNWKHFGNIRGVGLREIRKVREMLLHMPAFCLMPNHYHLLLLIEEISKMTEFMRKLNTGFTNFFNIKYDREGALFQGKYKRILIENEQQFAHIVVYIHLNPLDLEIPQWRDRALTGSEIKHALYYLENYRWSSHSDYLGKRNFPSVTSRDYFLKYFGGPEGYLDAVVNWLRAPKYGRVKDFTLE